MNRRLPALYPPKMTPARWTRLAGLCALLGLALQGAAVLGHAHEAGGHECALCHYFDVLFLLPEIPAGDSTPLAVAGLLEEPAAGAAESLPRLHPSRGPPA